MDERRVTANGVDFAYLSDGPDDGPLALCLHGFPDTAHSWRYQLPRLADAGYHAVAPFLRGYSPTEVPEDGRYDTGTLALDACALHEALGGYGRRGDHRPRLGRLRHLRAAAPEPDRWRRVVAAAVAPQGSMADGFFTFDQLRRSWYVFFFQTPAGRVCGVHGDLRLHRPAVGRLVARLRRLVGHGPGERGAGLPREPARRHRVLPGHVRRPARRRPDGGGEAAGGTVAPQPTLYLHGADDGCMGIGAIGPVTEFLAPGSEMVVVEGAGHFLHVERPDEVNDHIIRFITSSEA